MKWYVNWLVLRLAFLSGLLVFVLALFGILPGIFLFVGFTIYFVAIPFWLYPKERLLPSEKDMITVSILLGARVGKALLIKSRKPKVARGSLPTNIIPIHSLSRFHLPRRKA